MRLPIACVLAFAVAGCAGGGSAAREGREAAVRYARQWLACDQRDDDACAADLLHVPPGDAASEERERGNVRRGIRLIRDRFGGIVAFGPPIDDPAMVALSWTAGTREAWERFRVTATATFPVTFRKLSEGYLRAEVCRVGDAWRLKSIHYGLPLSNPSSAPMIEMTNAELGRLATDPSPTVRPPR